MKRKGAVLGTILLAMCAMLAIPFATMALLHGASNGTLARLDRTSAAYAPASAFAGLLAFGGVLYTISLQIRESVRARQQSLRTLHIDLMRMALEDESLMDCWGDFAESSDPTFKRQHVYVNLIVQHWRLMYQTEAFGLVQVSSMAGDLMQSPVAREYWVRAREEQSRVARSRDARRFIRAIDNAFEEKSLPQHDLAALPLRNDDR